MALFVALRFVESPLGDCPPPRSTVVSPAAQVRLARPASGLEVVGEESGEHRGALRRHAAGGGASFVPDEPFSPGERVCVRGAPGGDFSFVVARTPAVSGFATAAPERLDRGFGPVQAFASRLDLRPPGVAVTRRSPGAAPGMVLLAPKLGRGQDGPMIVDDRGELVWFRPMSGLTQVMDFRAQRYHGEPVLTWWQGRVGLGQGRGEGVILDRSYREVARVRAGNGYIADMHELTLTDRGTALITVYNPVPWDLSPIGGSEDGIVIEGVVQEIDIETGLVVWEWHSLDHIPVSESVYDVPREDDRPWDYFHLNSVFVDTDGDLILSARHTFAVYKIDRETGKVVWRLGGKRSDFRMGPGTRFAWQHDARRAPDGTITILDNAHTKAGPERARRLTERPGRERSRAIALRLDEQRRTATLEREVTEPRGLLADAQAGAHALPNGNLFVGWGSLRFFSEFDRRGRLVFDGRMAAPNNSYRAYRARWRGRPENRPAVAVGSVAPGVLDVAASWNGATDVARWAVLAGRDSAALRRVAVVPRTGFETRTRIRTRHSRVAVRALDARGRLLGESKPTHAAGPGTVSPP